MEGSIGAGGRCMSYWYKIIKTNESVYPERPDSYREKECLFDWNKIIDLYSPQYQTKQNHILLDLSDQVPVIQM